MHKDTFGYYQMKRLMTIKEAAEYLKLNQTTVYRLAQKHKIPASKVGGSWRFSMEILDQWLLQHALTDSIDVLVIDDDLLVCNLIEDILVRENYSVTIANTGEEALDIIEKKHFPLVFLDLILPGISGVDVLRAIKEKDTEAMVVIITGYGDAPVALEALSLCPIFLIRKPFEVADLRRVLDIVMKTQH